MDLRGQSLLRSQSEAGLGVAQQAAVSSGTTARTLPAFLPRGAKRAVGSSRRGSSSSEQALAAHGVAAAHSQGPMMRTDAERKANAERLNLDRRRLTACPVLQGEEKLRLLNMQNNSIARIDNLTGLPNLIFLDLYNNEIGAIENLHDVPTLRVLMLGKNGVSRIENLDRLPKLDVLDLHSNQLTRIENLGALRDLRVLNLAGNQIRIVDQLHQLSSLTELNLRRNRIESVTGLEGLRNLQRLFLSSNAIARFNDVGCIFNMPQLTELALDGNPLAQAPLYKTTLLDQLPSLRHLDLKRVSDEDRRVASLVAQQGGNPASPAASSVRASSAEPQPQPQPEPEAPPAADVAPPPPRPTTASRRAAAAIAAASGSASIASAPRQAASQARASSPPPHKSFSELENGGDRLCVYGNGLDRVDKYTRISSILLKYTSFTKLQGSVIVRLSRLEHLQDVTLSTNNMGTLAQVNELGLLMHLRELTIEDNPVVNVVLFRPFTIFRFSTLRTLNGEPVTSAERREAERIFHPLDRLAVTVLPTGDPAHLAVMNKRLSEYMIGAYADRNESRTSQSGLLRVRKIAESARSFVDSVVSQTVEQDARVQRLADIWPTLVAEQVREICATVAPVVVGDELVGATGADGHVPLRLGPWRRQPE